MRSIREFVDLTTKETAKHFGKDVKSEFLVPFHDPFKGDVFEVMYMTLNEDMDDFNHTIITFSLADKDIPVQSIKPIVETIIRGLNAD